MGVSTASAFWRDQNHVTGITLQRNNFDTSAGALQYRKISPSVILGRNICGPITDMQTGQVSADRRYACIQKARAGTRNRSFCYWRIRNANGPGDATQDIHKTPLSNLPFGEIVMSSAMLSLPEETNGETNANECFLPFVHAVSGVAGSISKFREMP